VRNGFTKGGRLTIDSAVEMVFGCLLVWTKTTGPMLLALLVVGLGIGILQAATQINEAAIGFLAKARRDDTHASHPRLLVLAKSGGLHPAHHRVDC
jgi:hypothetical protein